MFITKMNKLVDSLSWLTRHMPENYPEHFAGRSTDMIPMDVVAQKEPAKYSPQGIVAAIILNNKKRFVAHAEYHKNGGRHHGHNSSTCHSTRNMPGAPQPVRVSDFVLDRPHPALNL